MPFALAAPVLMALWRTSIMASGEIVNEDRGLGAMEPTIAAPASYPRWYWDGSSPSARWD